MQTDELDLQAERYAPCTFGNSDGVTERFCMKVSGNPRKHRVGCAGCDSPWKLCLACIESGSENPLCSAECALHDNKKPTNAAYIDAVPQGPKRPDRRMIIKPETSRKLGVTPPLRSYSAEELRRMTEVPIVHNGKGGDRESSAMMTREERLLSKAVLLVPNLGRLDQHILYLVSLNCANRAISARLNITEHIVYNRLSALYKYFGLSPEEGSGRRAFLGQIWEVAGFVAPIIIGPEPSPTTIDRDALRREALKFMPNLSPNERRLASLVERGITNMEIVRELGISYGTLSKNIRDLYDRLHLPRALGIERRGFVATLVRLYYTTSQAPVVK